MSVLPITMWPDPRLNVRCEEVRPEDVRAGVYDALVTDMWDTLYDAGGLGLSANQVGRTERIFVMDCGYNKQRVFYNPVVMSVSGDSERKNEGCLSLPGWVEMVVRREGLSVTSVAREDGELLVQHDLEGTEAQCVQHEVDHLNGITIPDRLGMKEKERRELERWLRMQREPKDGPKR